MTIRIVLGPQNEPILTDEECRSLPTDRDIENTAPCAIGPQGEQIYPLKSKRD